MSIVPGVMRNQWYPQRKAEYATAAKMKELGLRQEDVIQGGLLPANEDVIPNEASKEAADAILAIEESTAPQEKPIPFLRPEKPQQMEQIVPSPALDSKLEPDIPTVRLSMLISVGDLSLILCSPLKLPRLYLRFSQWIRRSYSYGQH